MGIDIHAKSPTVSNKHQPQDTPKEAPGTSQIQKHIIGDIKHSQKEIEHEVDVNEELHEEEEEKDKSKEIDLEDKEPEQLRVQGVP